MGGRKGIGRMGTWCVCGLDAHSRGGHVCSGGHGFLFLAQRDFKKRDGKENGVWIQVQNPRPWMGRFEDALVALIDFLAWFYFS